MGGWKMTAARRAAGRLVDMLDGVRPRRGGDVRHRDRDASATGRSRSPTTAPASRAIEFLARTERAAAPRWRPRCSTLPVSSLSATRTARAARPGAGARDRRPDRRRGPPAREPRARARRRTGVRGRHRPGRQRGAPRSDRTPVLGGASEFVESEDRLDTAMDRIGTKISTPALESVDIVLQGASAIEGTRTPEFLPALHPGAPLTVALRYRRDRNGTTPTAVVSGRRSDGTTWQQSRRRAGDGRLHDRGRAVGQVAPPRPRGPLRRRPVPHRSRRARGRDRRDQHPPPRAQPVHGLRRRRRHQQRRGRGHATDPDRPADRNRRRLGHHDAARCGRGAQLLQAVNAPSGCDAARGRPRLGADRARDLARGGRAGPGGRPVVVVPRFAERCSPHNSSGRALRPWHRSARRPGPRSAAGARRGVVPDRNAASAARELSARALSAGRDDLADALAQFAEALDATPADVTVLAAAKQRVARLCGYIGSSSKRRSRRTTRNFWRAKD